MSRARRREWDAPALGLVAFTLAVTLSRFIAPAFAELPRLASVEALEAVVRAVANRGASELWSPSARAAYASFGGEETLLRLLAAWSRLSVGRLGLLDPLTSARLPWIALAALGPALVVVAARRSLGRAPALLAGVLLLVTPRWLHAASMGADSAALASAWWLVIAACLRSLSGRPRFASVALALGAALSVSLAALWVVPLVVAHHLFARRELSRRLARRGRQPWPAPLVGALALAPVFVYGLNPALWGAKPLELVAWVLAPLAPERAPTLYAGKLVGESVPLGFGPLWLTLSLPAVLLAGALLGLVVFAHRTLARRYALGALRPPPDRTALGGLVALGLAATALGPALAPEPLVVLPPRIELALPFVAIAAAAGLERASVSLLGPARWRFGAAGVAGVLLALTLRAPRTASASFDALTGGARAVVLHSWLPAGDGSELGVLAPTLDRLPEDEVTLSADSVPAALWDALTRAGRLRLRVRVVPSGGALVLSRGAARDGDPLATVTRDGATLWTLSRRR
ncbi:MAG: hypothetical protein OZ921_05615 [Sorangiineae bacterium]|nr:hypothetical protein [Polyangiaceae bacterium]MEB2321972.1 hypothetical protein [Sorangiineae bacterium]